MLFLTPKKYASVLKRKSNSKGINLWIQKIQSPKINHYKRWQLSGYPGLNVSILKSHQTRIAMKVLFMIILIIHGLIHLLGFLKAFLLAELNEITNPVSKSSGLLWLLTSLILVSAGTMLFLKNPIWWLIAIIGVLLSQILIIVFWNDCL